MRKRNETNNMKSTCPTQTQPPHTQHVIFHWLMLRRAFGLPGFVLGPPGFYDTNMLGLAMGKSRIGGITQRKAPMQGVSRSGGI